MRVRLGVLLALALITAVSILWITPGKSRDLGTLQPVDPELPACCFSGKCCGLEKTSKPTLMEDAFGPLSLPSLAPAEKLPQKPVMKGKATKGAAGEENKNTKSTGDTNSDASPPPLCSIQRLIPPISLRRVASFYGLSTHFSECTAAAKALLALRTKSGKYTVTLNEIATTPAEKEAYAAALTTYGAACLARLASDDASTLLRPTGVATIQDTVGTFHIDSKRPFCTGVVVGARVLTARHCFASPITTTSISPKLRFRTFSGRETDVSLATTFHEPPVRHARDDDDWVVFEAPGLSGGRSLEIAQPAQWEELFIPSFDPHANILAQLGKTEATLLDPQLDLSPLCRVAVIDGRLLAHACQTEHGFSGSPLLAVRANDRIVVVGLQSGRTEGVTDHCPGPMARFFPNFGVALPPEIIERLSKP